ncbi:MAG: caspase family protein [Bacteroidota bacterium]
MKDNNYQKTFLRLEIGGHTSEITELLVTSDGKQIITSSVDKTIRIWDVASSKEIAKILGQIDTGASGVIRAMALSPDDKYLIAAVYTGPGHQSNSPPYDPNDVLIRIYDFQTRDLVRVFAPGNTNVIISLDMSSDGKYLVAGSDDSTIKIWDFPKLMSTEESPKPFKELSDDPLISRPKGLKIVNHEDDYRLIIADFGEYNNQVYIYSFNQDKFIASDKLGEQGVWLEYISVSDDFIAVCGDSHEITIYNLDLEVIKKLASEPNPVDVIFSPDGNYLLVGTTETPDNHPFFCQVFDVKKDFKLITKFKGHDAKTQAVEFVDNQTAISCGGNKKEILTWNILTGEIKDKIEPVGSTIYALGIDGKRIAFGFSQDFKKDENNYAPLEKVFDLEDFTITDLDTKDQKNFKRARIEKDGEVLYIDPDSTWDLFLIRDNSNYYRMWRDGGWYYHEVYSFTDDNMIVTGGRGGEVRAYTRDGYTQSKFIGHAGKVWDLATQGNWMVTGGVEQVVKLWNLDQLKNGEGEIFPMLNFFFSTEGEWVVWSQSGFYHASTKGDKYVGYHINQGEIEEALFYTSDRFIKSLFRPDVIKAIIETGSEKAALAKLNLSEAAEVTNILPPKVIYKGPLVHSTDQHTYQLSWSVDSSNEQATRTWILRNDEFYWQLSQKDGKVEGDHRLTIDLLPGTNTIKILAESIISKSNPITITIDANIPKIEKRGGMDLSSPSNNLVEVEPNLYLLSIGVSIYNPSARVKNLNFAHSDAQQVNSSFNKQGGKLFNTVSSKLIINQEATKKGILEAVDWMKKEITSREKNKKDNKQVSRDIAVVFMAGHGIKKDDKFYFLNHDCDLDDLENTAISLLDLGEVITSFSSEIVIFTDACHAGKISSDLAELIDSKELNKRLNAINERAQIILNATTAGKPAYESKDEQRGIFTGMLLEGLKDREEVTILHLADFVSYNVKKKTKKFPGGAQTPILTIYGSLDNYEIYKNDDNT